MYQFYSISLLSCSMIGMNFVAVIPEIEAVKYVSELGLGTISVFALFVLWKQIQKDRESHHKELEAERDLFTRTINDERRIYITEIKEVRERSDKRDLEHRKQHSEWNKQLTKLTFSVNKTSELIEKLNK